jgi:adenylosuccinate synthase
MTVEGQLKSAIQSHFLSVDSCMEQLCDISENIKDIKATTFSIQSDYRKIAHLETALSELRREATKHKQLKSAKENVKNILNFDDLSKQASKYIEKDQLLFAHKCLVDMEKCRNDILEELGPPSDENNNIADIKVRSHLNKQN